jgi:hypothetical protein
MHVNRLIKRLIIATFSFLTLYLQANSASISLLPASGLYTVGQNIPITMYVTGNSEAINAVSGQLSFSKDMLQISSIVKDGSIIKLWAEEPTFSNKAGTINLAGVVFNGFNNAKGKIVTINFTAKRTGQASVLFSSGSVLANDGEATNVLEDLNGASLTIAEGDKNPKPSTSPSTNALTPTAPIITSATHPNTDSWYTAITATFAWDPPSDVVDVRGSLDAIPNSVPTETYGTGIKTRTINIPSDGVYYFHLQYKNTLGWGAITHYPVKLDTVRPEVLSIKLIGDKEKLRALPSFIINAKDKTSGIASFGMKLDYEDVVSIAPQGEDTIYTISGIAPGKHTLIVRALDKAGNATMDSIDFEVIPLEKPIITSYKDTLLQGDKIEILGKTKYASSTVEVVYVDDQNNEYKDSTATNYNGDFAMTYLPHLKAGIYQMKARVIDNSDGAQSYYTDPKRVTIKSVEPFSLGTFILNWLSLILIAIVATFLILLILWYSYRKFREIKNRIARRMNRAEALLPRDIEELTKNLVENHDMLMAVAENRDLTKEEDAMLENLKRQLETTDKDLIEKVKSSRYLP